jgi:hypothetical protein
MTGTGVASEDARGDETNMDRMATHKRTYRHAEPAAKYRVAIAAAAPVATVTLIAGIMSYTHIVALGLRAAQGSVDAHLLPFAVDGLIVGGVVIVLAGYWLGWSAVALGVGATVFANVESGLPHGPLAATVAAWPAVAFSVASFVLERWLKTRCLPGLGVHAEPVVTAEPVPVVMGEVPAVVTPPPAPVVTPEPAVVVPAVDTTPEPSEDTPVVTTRRRRAIPADATDDQLADIILDHADDPATLTPYRVNKILKEQGRKQKVGDPRAARIIAAVQRKHREHRVYAIGERR